MLWRWEVDEIGSGSCPVAGFGIDGVKTFGSITKELGRWSVSEHPQWEAAYYMNKTASLAHVPVNPSSNICNVFSFISQTFQTYSQYYRLVCLPLILAL